MLIHGIAYLLVPLALSEVAICEIIDASTSGSSLDVSQRIVGIIWILFLTIAACASSILGTVKIVIMMLKQRRQEEQLKV